jgi:hypothetical protein
MQKESGLSTFLYCLSAIVGDDSAESDAGRPENFTENFFLLSL